MTQNQLARLIGYLIGKRIPRWLEKKPVAYLYNGVRLPALPNWDKETYPYATIQVIEVSNEPSFYMLCVFSHDPVHDDYLPGYDYRFILDASVPWKTMHYRHSERFNDEIHRNGWEYRYSNSNDDGDSTYVLLFPSRTFDRIIWANVDFVNKEGKLCLAASEPVPVYE